jgi:hypothetical protein
MKDKAFEKTVVMSSDVTSDAVSDAYEQGVRDGFQKAVELLKNPRMDNYHNKMAEKFAQFLEANGSEN